jgi:HK97 family phage prohead protease
MEKRYSKAQFPVLGVRAKIEPKTVNDEDRTVEVVVATNTPVRMWSWDRGSHLEELDMKGIRMDRMDIAPVLDNHNSYGGARGVLGAVVPGSARVEGSKLMARIQFSPNESVTDIWNNVKAGILRTISVGYQVHRAELVKNEGDVKTYRASDWEPFEVSLAPIPADAKAVIRNTDPETFDVEVEEEENNMQRDMDHIHLISERYKNL